MHDLRSRIAKYNESYFLLYICTLNIMYSLGDIKDIANYTLYKIGLVIAFGSMGLKVFFTDYTKKEVLIGTIFFTPLIINFCINRELYLFMFFAGIVAAKGVDLKKVFVYVFWIKLSATCLTWGAVLLGIIENKVAYLLKNDELVGLRCFGYFYPNVAYANLLSIAILLILVYQDRVKWYYYVLLTAFFYGMYELLYCRTGFIIWLLLCVLLLFDKCITNRNLKKNIFRMAQGTGIFITCISILLPLLYRNETWSWTRTLDFIVNARIRAAFNAMQRMEWTVLGQKEYVAFDNIFVHVLHNDGIIYLVLLNIGIFLFLRWLFKEQKSRYLLIAVIMLICSYMEFYILTLSWCPLWLLAAQAIWPKEPSEETNRRTV